MPGKTPARFPNSNVRLAPLHEKGTAWPIIDGGVIPDDQYKLNESGCYNDTPILVGYNSDEGQTFSPPKTPEDYIASVKARYGPFADQLIAAYPPGRGTVAKSARDLTRDAMFGCAHLDLGPPARQSGKVEGVLLLL